MRKGKSETPLAKAVDKQLYILGLTRLDLAKKAGLANMTVYNILNGKASLTIYASKKIAPIVGIEDMELRRLASQGKTA